MLGQSILFNKNDYEDSGSLFNDLISKNEGDLYKEVVSDTNSNLKFIRLNLEDKKNSFVTEFGNIPLPTTILLNSTGKIIKVNIGFDDKVDEEKELAKEIKKLL